MPAQAPASARPAPHRAAIPCRAIWIGWLLAGCGGGVRETPISNPVVASALAACDAADGTEADWCRLRVVQSDAARAGSGDELTAVCEAIERPVPRDICFERSLNTLQAPTTDVCGRIGDERLRDSCYLAKADRLLDTVDDPQRARVICEGLADHEEDCLVHFLTRRDDAWQHQGVDAMNDQISALVQGNPEVDSMVEFGGKVGRMSTSLGLLPGSRNPCAVFSANSPAKAGCASTYGKSAP